MLWSARARFELAQKLQRGEKVPLGEVFSFLSGLYFRGKLAYVHVRQLKDMDLISDERIGRTRMLRTTTTFADYFNLNHDPSLMKKELKKVLQLGEDAPSSIETVKPDS